MSRRRGGPPPEPDDGPRVRALFTPLLSSELHRAGEGWLTVNATSLHFRSDGGEVHHFPLSMFREVVMARGGTLTLVGDDGDEYCFNPRNYWFAILRNGGLTLRVEPPIADDQPPAPR